MPDWLSLLAWGKRPTSPVRAASAAWPDAESGRPRPQMVLFLLAIIAAMALGIIGVVVKGLLYLLIIGVLLLPADMVFFGARCMADDGGLLAENPLPNVRCLDDPE
jgi:hypothetical protein